MSAKNIEAIFPLSPLQQGMLFHTVSDERERFYFEQLIWTLHGDVNTQALARAWQQVIDRHQSLRTMFVWEGMDEPLQVVGERVSLPLDQQDWRARPPSEQRSSLALVL